MTAGNNIYTLARFQSTLPAGEATSGLPEITLDEYLFQSTLPAGEATSQSPLSGGREFLFQSTLPAGEATLRQTVTTVQTAISIHASRGGSDWNGTAASRPGWDFNPRFPRGKRLPCIAAAESGVDFNPRFPRGKRHQLPHLLAGGLHISIHASRGGSDFFEIGGLPFDDISIHASRGGSDQEPKQGDAPAGISIHASRGGSDLLIQWDVRRHPDFNPRFPRGKRQHSLIRFPKSSISIHASRGGSDKMTKFYDGKKTVISIHASRGGSDIKLTLVGIIVGNFNPRFPRGKRP